MNIAIYRANESETMEIVLLKAQNMKSVTFTSLLIPVLKS